MGMEHSYDPKVIEKKWQKYWEDHETFRTDVHDFSKPKFYALDMFPYPSGVGLHAGHPEGYTATDIVSRMKRMQGYASACRRSSMPSRRETIRRASRRRTSKPSANS